MEENRTGFIRIITEASVSTGGKEGHPGVKGYHFMKTPVIKSIATYVQAVRPLR